MNRFFVVIAVVLFFLGACSRQQENGSNTFPQEYAKAGLPEVHLSVSQGDTVLVPQSKFLDAFFGQGKNFFWFQPRRVDSAGEYSVFVWEIDSIVEVPNAFVISFPGHCAVAEGDFVFTWWQRGSGLQRAYVVKVLDDKHIIVRYLDLDVFTVQGEADVIDTINQGSFSVIKDEFDPGASVCYCKSTGKEFYTIINRGGGKLICRSELGKVIFVDRDSVRPNGVIKQLKINQQVEVPFYGIYIPAHIVSLHDGYVKAKVQIVDRVDTLAVPMLDVRVD